MTNKRKILKEIQSKLKEATKSDGFFITLTIIKDGLLHPYYAQVEFGDLDIPIAWEQLAKMLSPQLNPKLQITTTKAEA